MLWLLFFFGIYFNGRKIFTWFYIFVLLLCVSWDIVIAGSIIQLFNSAFMHDICTPSNWFSFSFVFRHFKRTEVYIFLFLVVEFASGEFDIRLGTVVLCGKFWKSFLTTFVLQQYLVLFPPLSKYSFSVYTVVPFPYI